MLPTNTTFLLLHFKQHVGFLKSYYVSLVFRTCNQFTFLIALSYWVCFHRLFRFWKAALKSQWSYAIFRMVSHLTPTFMVLIFTTRIRATYMCVFLFLLLRAPNVVISLQRGQFSATSIAGRVYWISGPAVDSLHPRSTRVLWWSPPVFQGGSC